MKLLEMKKTDEKEQMMRIYKALCQLRDTTYANMANGRSKRVDFRGWDDWQFRMKRERKY